MNPEAPTLTRDQAESFATQFYGRTVSLARTEAERLQYTDVEEFESIAVAELWIALTEYPHEARSIRVWGWCKLRIARRLAKEVRVVAGQRATLERYKARR